MRVYNLRIRNFRGIKELDWCVPDRFVCLVGPRDCRKSTVLDAIEYVLSPRWNVVFEDTDFYDLDTSQPIEITATVGEVPAELLTEDKFGLEKRGWDRAKGELHDEATESDLEVLSIRLRVDSALEPEWTVVNDRSEGKRISHKDRELLGVLRLGASVDWHLGWGRGSILSRLTQNSREGKAITGGILAEAARAARKSFDPDGVDVLCKAAQRTETLGKELSVLPAHKYQPHLDFQALSVGLGGITLHDGEIPLRRAGLGTRRLVALALQKEAAQDGGIALVDEVEHALEPHTIGRLLAILRKASTGAEKAQGAVPNESVAGQVLLTTHSPVVVVELDATNLCMVRSDAGRTTVQAVPATLQNIVRTGPDAFLGKRVIVCEGKTELGFCRALDSYWSDSAGSKGKESFALLGVVPIASMAGGGTEAPKIAFGFATLGFKTALLADSDEPLDPTVTVLESAGVKVVQWEDAYCIEQRVFADLPWLAAAELVNAAIEEKSAESVRSAVAEKCGIRPSTLPEQVETWNTLPSRSEQDMRSALGRAAKSSKWFKRLDLGKRMGEIVTPYLDSIPTTDLARKIALLRQWVVNDG